MEASSVTDFFATAEFDPMSSAYSFDIGIEGEDDLEEKINGFETFNSEQGEHQPGELSLQKKRNTRQLSVPHKKFRLVEELSDSLVYTGDSFGSRSYIDANERTACPQSCFCWLHDQAPGVFTFIAHKSSSRLVVNFYSDALYSEVIQVIGPEKMAEEELFGQDDPPKSLNGFCLLQSFQNLQAHLNFLRCYAFTDPTLSPVISEMELLVHGFLADGEVFKSYGYEHLYENGYLFFELWKAFQQDQLQRDISTLNERFIAIDDSNVFEDFDVEDSQDPVQLFGIPSEDFDAVEAQQDGDQMSSSQSSQYCIAEAFIIEDAQSGNNLWFGAIDSDVFTEYIRLLFAHRTMLDAIESGSEKVVRDMLATGAAVNGFYPSYGFTSVPLLVAARTGRDEIVRLLLKQGALHMEKALILAAGAGHAAVVNSLLDHNRATNDCSNKAFRYFAGDDYDPKLTLILERSESQNGEAESAFLFFGVQSNVVMRSSGLWTEEVKRFLSEIRGLAASDMALIEAAAAGHEEVVKILLDNGADLEGTDMLCKRNAAWVRERRVPVVEAAKEGHGAVTRLLLQRGAVVSSLQPLMSPFKKYPTFGRLNKRFIQQYRLMTEAILHSSAGFPQLCTRFNNHREAWSAGISTMRRLCNGKPPRGLQNAVAFLCISRAMSETLDSTNGTDYTSQFLEDLERWQILFKSKELKVYRELIHSMWGTILSENKSKSWKASDFLTLTHFQALLSTLIRQTNEPVNLHGPHDQSLQCSQQRFLARSHQIPTEPEVDLPTANLGLSNETYPQSPDSTEPKPPDIPVTPKKMSLEENVENDISAANLRVTVVVLMAGAIFAILVIFLQCASLNPLFPSLLFR